MRRKISKKVNIDITSEKNDIKTLIVVMFIIIQDNITLSYKH